MHFQHALRARVAELSALIIACGVMSGLLPVSAAADEPVILGFELGAAAPLTAPQNDEFGIGGAAAASLELPVAPVLNVGLRVRGLLLSEGNAPSDPAYADKEFGTLGSVALLLRLRPLGAADDLRRATGLWLDTAAGGGLTGQRLRPAVELGAGWGFAAESFTWGPFLRYVQAVDSTDALDDRDARIAVVGVSMSLFDRREKIEVTVREEPLPPPEPTDRDADGIADSEDQCPDEAEDRDQFEDTDGCPDDDNDGDGVADLVDQCPDVAEDEDGFEDADGCPDPDNDEDGIPDEEDACPNERETVNGIEDQDGCPDKGLIEMIDDRIVLEERVLFDFQRARVKRRARPVLKAIAELWRQHPEWARLRVEGHADVRGREAYNQSLSERRARNVMQGLIWAGIPKEIIDFKGYGSSRPRDPGNTKKAHARNRRVEFVVISRHPAEAVEEMKRGEQTSSALEAGEDDSQAQPGDSEGNASGAQQKDDAREQP